MNEYRIGYGEDIHRLEKGDHLRLCGVTIPFNKRITAHSDGDCPFHAVADALLGSLALGDIGDFFPPSDPMTKGLDSASIIKKAADLILKKGYRVINVDVTIILEQPRLSPFKSDMRENLARALGIDVDRVSVKAGTNEKLDAIGKGEAIKAVAVVLVGK